MKNLNNLLKLLLESDFEFVLIGGYAGALYGSSLLTQDLDICAKCTPENISRLRAILESFHPVHRMTPQKLSFLSHPQDLGNIKNLYLSSDLGALDILSDVIGVGDYSKVRESAQRVRLFERPCFVISIQHLIDSKKKMNRPKDQVSVEELELIQTKTKK